MWQRCVNILTIPSQNRHFSKVIRLHRLNDSQLWVSVLHIVTIEKTPDTLIRLLNGDSLVVKEPVEQVCALITDTLSTLWRSSTLLATEEH